MDVEQFEDRMGVWSRGEITLIRVFTVLFVAFTVSQIAYDIWQREVLDLSFNQIMLGIGSYLVVAFALTSFLLGFYFIHGFRGEGIVDIKQIVKTMVQVSFVVAVFFTILLALDIGGHAETGLYDEGGPTMTTARYSVTITGFMALTILGTFGAMLAILVGGFGIMGMMYTFEVGGVPKFLHKLEGVTRREDRESKFIMWFMVIPGALDTDTMLVDEKGRETEFPWSRFRSAVLWQIAFGIIIAIYVSLNPWLLRAFSINELFRFMSTAFVVIPFVVIPWFIFRRLNARFKGVSRDFLLYAAFKDRMTRLIIAGGTLLIFLRMAYESFDLDDLLVALTSYIFIMVLCIIAFTFVYFNFFENKLTEECLARWVVDNEATKEPEDEEVGGDPPLSVAE
jgi:hypothetical protein